MATTCSVVEHPPVEGKGYFVLPGDRLQASTSELVKSKPWVVLKGPKGCGYLGCRSSFYESIGSHISDYPQVLKCQMRQPLHNVAWATLCSNVLLTVKLQLIYLEKQIQSKFRAKPHFFRVCKPASLGVKTDPELDDIEFSLSDSSWSGES